MSTKIETRNIDDLEIHPALRTQPRLSDDELLTWRKSMKRRGESATPPIYVTADDKIVDGRHRYWCSKKLGWKTIPVQVVKEDEIFAIIFESLVNRRHYSKGQLAYVAAPMVEGVFSESKKRMLAGGAQSGAAQETPESIAAGMGISYRVLAQAQEIHQFFENDKTKRNLTDRDEVTEKNVTLKEFFEPRILLVEDPEAPRTRAYGLGAVLAGIKQVLSVEQRNVSGRGHGGGRPDRVEKQLALFIESLHGVENKFTYWAKWDEETRGEAVKVLNPMLEKMPPDLLVEFSKAIKLEQKRRGQ
jgi:hypothetical protein